MQFSLQSLQILPSPIEAVEWTAAHIIEVLQAAISKRGRASLVLAGGSTFQEVYERLAATNFSWDKVDIFFGDERCVEPSDSRSNFLMAHHAWLNSFPGRAYRMPGELPPNEGAEKYTTILKEWSGGELPGFDLILLGLGSDGHTASLFPVSMDIWLDTEKWVLPLEPGLDPFVSRLSLTPVVINAAHEVLVMAGPSKKEILKKLLADNPEKYPILQLNPQGKYALVTDSTSIV